MTWVLLHGASGNAASWEPVLAHLPGRCLALDLPGRGAHPGLPAVRAADAAAALVEHLPDDAVVVGHSYGGAVGLQLALDVPGRLRGLVLVSSAARLRVHPAILAAVAAATPDAPYRLDAAFGPGTPREVVEAYARAIAHVPPATAVGDWAACDGFDVIPRLGELDLPVCVVHGDADALAPAKHQRGLAEAIRGAVRVELPGVGHMVPWEAPEALGRVLRRWSAR